MDPACSLRAATFADISHLTGLMREAYAEADFALDTVWAEATFTTLLGGSSKGFAWIAFEAGLPAGFIVLTLRFSMEFGGTDGFVDDLFVRPSSRCRGIGTALLAALLAEAEHLGLEAVHVETSAANLPAVALYRSQGLEDRERLLLTRRLTHRQEIRLSESHA